VVLSEHPLQLYLRKSQWQVTLNHLLACLPEEGCGLLAGRQENRAAYVTVVLPIANELHSPVRFRMDPLSQLQAFQWLDEQGLDLLAIFHSHPAGPAYPSATDQAEFAYPGVLTLIVSPHSAEDGWQARAYALDLEGSGPTEVPIEIMAELD
jgi:proteasome lid subunit RPN8/RPN11